MAADVALAARDLAYIAAAAAGFFALALWSMRRRLIK